jgi:hypothetical protein
MTNNLPPEKLHPRLYRMITTASEHIDRMWKLAGSVASVWHYVRANGDEVVTLSPPVPKDAGIALMRKVLAQEDAVAVLYFDEAWTFLTSDPQEAQRYVASGMGAAAHPRRVEIVHFQAEDETGQLLAMRKIIRHAGRPPELGPLEIKDESIQSVGRMVGMLPRRGTMQ